jgi:DNA-directed RNA polymerase subunit RPC12/RpoP
MARSPEQDFRCTLCGATFKAIYSPAPDKDVVCNECGLRHSPEKLRRLIAAKKASGRR